MWRLLPLTRLNFTYRFSNVEDGKWGHIEAGPQGREWNGMVAQVSQLTNTIVII